MKSPHPSDSSVSDGYYRRRVSQECYRDIDCAQLDAHFQGSYGLVSAEHLAMVVLHFRPPVAHRVVVEPWHPQQQGEWLDPCTFELRLPYNAQQPQELIMDILRYGDQVTVVEPGSLRRQICETLAASLARYREKTND